MGKKEIFERINDKNIPLVQLADRTNNDKGIKIEEYVGVPADNNSQEALAYGVNVKLSKDATTELLPFFYCNLEGFDSKIVADRVVKKAPDRMIPDFLKEFGIKEAVFTATFTCEISVEKNKLNADISDIKLINDDDKVLNPFVNNEAKKISDEFFKGLSFLSENIKELKEKGMQSNKVFVWVRGEDPNQNGEVSYLTNIFAISTDENRIKELQKKTDDILEFVMLLKSRKMDDYVIAQKKESIKSAVAALMARNMSHNLGSHYLTNTKNYFSRQIKKLEQQQMLNGILPDYRGSVAMLQYIQERMDFIATLVSFDKYPFGSLNFKSQFFDILTEDDHGARHEKETQNFLLKYLVFSENLTRGKNIENYYYRLKLVVKYHENDNTYIFTGDTTEKIAKFELSKLNLAIPGGLMARHALFTIIENIIRNSAKHSQNDTDLVITIDLKLENEKVIISIFDNRKNEEGYNNVKDSYQKLCIINEEGRLDKNSMGLKEILICVLWLQNKNVTDILYDIQNTEEGEERFTEIYKHLRITNGENITNGEKTPCYSFDLPVFSSLFFLEESKHYELKDELKKQKLSFIDSKKLLTTELYADIIGANEDYSIANDAKEEDKSKYSEYSELFRNRKLSDIFPRLIIDNNISNKDNEGVLLKKIKPDYFKKIIAINCTRYDGPSIYDGETKVVDTASELVNYDINFYDHLENKTLSEKLQILEKGKYVESVSGENFTSTIATNAFLSNVVLRYKTVEAALSRIIIIDERIFGDFKKRQEAISIVRPKIIEWWDDAKEFDDLYDLCYNKHWSDVPTEKKSDVEDLRDSEETDEEKKRILKEFLFSTNKVSEEFSKMTDEQKEKANQIEQMMLEAKNIFVYDFNKEMNGFVDLSNHPVEKVSKDNSESFLSIHLGLIQKYKDAHKNEYKGTDKDEALLYTLNGCISMIRDTFKVKYIAIHSGRGNFSADLSKGLSSYPFISLSALEAAFYNCKYFLSELFHNINYYGKGCLNN